MTYKPFIMLGQPSPRYYARQDAHDRCTIYELTPQGERPVGTCPIFTDALAIVTALNEHQKTLLVPANRPFTYARGWLGQFIVYENGAMVATSHERVYAAAVTNALNWCSAIFAHLPISLIGSKKSAN